MARLESYSFGRVVVDGGERTRDLIVLSIRLPAPVGGLTLAW